MTRWLILLLLFPASLLADPPVISNPADPPRIETWQLREVWTLDEESDPDMPLMGAVMQGAVDSKGNVLLLDRQLAHILVVSPEGEYIRTLGRSGQGPGEMEQPSSFFLADSGNIGLIQTYPAKVVWLQPDGLPGGDIRMQGMNPMFYNVDQRGGNLVASVQTLDISAGGDNVNHRALARLSDWGEPMNNYHELVSRSSHDPPVIKEEGTWFPTWAWSLAPDGSVLLATRRDEYRIERREPGGRTRAVITREFTPHRRSKVEREKVLSAMRMWGPGGEIEAKKSILDTEPAIKRVQVLDDGTIWVQSCYAKLDLPEGVHIRYDVFSAEGKFEVEVRIAWPVDPDDDYFEMLNDGRFILYRNGRNAVNAMFAGVEDREPEEEDLDDEDIAPSVVLLERADF